MKDLRIYMQVLMDARSVKTGADAIRTSMHGIQSSIASVVKGAQALNHELNGFSTVTKLGGAMVGGSLLRDTMRVNMEFERAMLEMRQNAGMTKETMLGVKKDIMGAARELYATPVELQKALTEFTKAGFTGEKFKVAQNSYKESARAAMAFFVADPTAGDASTVASMDVDLIQKSDITPETLPKVHNMMLSSGYEGRFEAKDFAQNAPKILNSGAKAGLTGVKGVNLISALSQQYMQLANPKEKAEVATFFEHFFSHITDQHYVKALTKKGVDVKKFYAWREMKNFDTGKLEKRMVLKGEGGVEGYIGLMKDLKKKGMENPFEASEGGFREMYTRNAAMKGMMSLSATEAAMTRNEDAYKNDLIGQQVADIKDLNVSKMKVAEIELQKLQLSDSAGNTVSGAGNLTQKFADHGLLTGALAAGTALVLGRYGLKKLPAWASAKLAEKTAVSAVTKPSVGAMLGIKKMPAPISLGEKLAPYAKKLPLLGNMLAIGMGGVNAYEISRSQLSEREKAVAQGGNAGGTIGGMAGAWGGAAAGAALGTAVFPGVGTAIGGLLGMLAGGMSGGSLGETIGAAITDAFAQKESSQPISITNNVIVDGNVIAQSVNDLNARSSRRN
ncbi:MAG: hypothetical protein WCK93_07490 [Nitrosomonadales bacterium]